MEHPSIIPPIEYAEPQKKHWLEAIPLYAINGLFQSLPAPLTRGLARGLAGLGHWVLKKKVQQSVSLVQERLGCDELVAQRVIRESFQNFAKNWLVQVCPQKIIPSYELCDHGLTRIHENMKAGQGTIIAAMHMGLWESVPLFCKKQGIPLAVVVAVQHNPLCDKVFNDARSAGGYHYILHNRLGVRHLLKYLKKGGVVVILSDVDVAEHGIPVPFLGKMASTPSWPAELALRTGADLCLGYNVILEQKLHYHLEPLVLADASEDHNATQLSTHMNDEMSKVVQKYPEQWFWMQRRWKTPMENLKTPL
jgi:lauroyl/myristoyl acyltransferase